MRIAVACGGTGGHIFPGLATAEALRRRGHDVGLWLAGKDVESEAVKGWTGPVVTMQAKGLPTRMGLGALQGAVRLVTGIRRCTARMSGERPDVVLGMGSYASVGPVGAAIRLRIPAVLHESNAVPGRAVSLLSRGSAAVAISFDATRSYLSRRRRVVLTGMPLREEIVRAAATAIARPGGSAFTVLVMGGSRGAHALNEIGAEALIAAHKRGQLLRVIHLTGEKDEAEVAERYRRAGVAADVRAFTHGMAEIYANADLSVCRSGAATCAELSILGVPSLLVPLPSAVRDHQTANARAMERAGAADMIPQRDLNPSWLCDYVVNAARNRARLTQLSESAKRMSLGGGPERLVELVESIGAPLHAR